MTKRLMKRTSLALLLVLTVTTAGFGFVPAPTSSMDLHPVPVEMTSTEVSGQGILAKLGCLGCAGVILGVGGTSVIGVAITAVAFPELIAVCGAGCILAFT
jgi:hypothetical protein